MKEVSKDDNGKSRKIMGRMIEKKEKKGNEERERKEIENRK